MDEELKKLFSQISNLRQKPLLSLIIKDVGTEAVFLLEKELSSKNFAELDVILQTPGGSADQAFQIAKLLRMSGQKVNIIIPYFAKSAGTLLSLVADKYILTDLSELGPLDTQIRESQEDGPKYKSALEEFKALEKSRDHCLETLDYATQMIIGASGMKIPNAVSLAIDFVKSTSAKLYDKMDPIKIGKYARALDIGERYGVEILTRFMKRGEEESRKIISALVYNYPSHNYIIDSDELKDLGFEVEVSTGDLNTLLINARMILTKQTFEGNYIHLFEVKENVKSQAKSKSIRKGKSESQ